MKSVEIDRTKLLRDQPATGHNRLHPDIPPILEVDEGEEVVLETRDGCDGYLGPSATAASIATMDTGAVHPLTGPVLVKGARPGDVLEIEMVDVLPQPHAFTAIVPGLGFLRDLYTTPYLVKWRIADGWATSPELPGVRIPGAPFMGVIGVAPSHDQLRAWTVREQACLERGGLVMVPDAAGAVPGKGKVATEGLRTISPRENGGNMDIKQITKGSTLSVPVTVDGALFSVGDGHFAQGDGEVCVTAVEMGATAVVRFRVVKGAAKKPWRGPALQPPRLLRAAGVGGAEAFHRGHRHAHPRRRRERGREPHAGLPQRPPQHDRPAPGARLDARAGLRDLQRRRRPAHQQCRRRAELRRLRAPARGDLPGVMRRGGGYGPHGPLRLLARWTLALPALLVRLRLALGRCLTARLMFRGRRRRRMRRVCCWPRPRGPPGPGSPCG